MSLYRSPAACVRIVWAHRSRKENLKNFKFDGNILPRACDWHLHFGRKGQSQGHTDRIKFQIDVDSAATLTTLSSVADMLTVCFNKCDCNFLSSALQKTPDWVIHSI